MLKKKLKVAMICHFTNPKVQQKLKLKISFGEYIERKVKHLPTDPYKFLGEYSVWIGNAIDEYERMTNEIELHVITPHNYMSKAIQEFEINGIYYHFFRNENSRFITRLKNHFPFLKKNKSFKENRKKISVIRESIKPDVVYVIGIECPFYSLASLDVPKDVPLFVQLQTLMSDPEFEKNYPISHEEYVYKSSVEADVIKRADYIGTTIEKIQKIVKRDIKPNAIILKTKLAVGEKIYRQNDEKKYDFVYFAANISKAFDLALEGFTIAHKQKPNIKLLVVGAYDTEYKKKMDTRIKELGLGNSITFTGRLPTHDDVLSKIRESKHALLPLKIDIVSGTIREALANGLPVITTITEGGTPMLNKTRETVLLSPIGNHEALAENMIRLLNDPELAACLRENGYIQIQECYSNTSLVQQQKRALFAAYENYTNDAPISQDVLS